VIVGALGSQSVELDEIYKRHSLRSVMGDTTRILHDKNLWRLDLRFHLIGFQCFNESWHLGV